MKPTGSGTPSDFVWLRALEDTPKLHHAIVCTLCSCYPRPLLGIAPSWYERSNYRRRLSALASPGDGRIRHRSPTRRRSSHPRLEREVALFVIPLRPAGTEGWSEEKLAKIVTRDTMIGVAFCNKDWTYDSKPGDLAWQRDG